MSAGLSVFGLKIRFLHMAIAEKTEPREKGVLGLKMKAEPKAWTVGERAGTLKPGATPSWRGGSLLLQEVYDYFLFLSPCINYDQDPSSSLPHQMAGLSCTNTLVFLDSRHNLSAQQYRYSHWRKGIFEKSDDPYHPKSVGT